MNVKFLYKTSIVVIIIIIMLVVFIKTSISFYFSSAKEIILNKDLISISIATCNNQEFILIESRGFDNIYDRFCFIGYNTQNVSGIEIKSYRICGHFGGHDKETFLSGLPLILRSSFFPEGENTDVFIRNYNGEKVLLCVVNNNNNKLSLVSEKSQGHYTGDVPTQ